MQSIIYQKITTKNGQCGFCQIGTGPPLIMIVGYSGTLYHWNKEFVYELAKKFTVCLVDNRKIGLSETNNHESMQGLAQDIVDFIEALNLSAAYILGWSMGGMVTQTLLTKFPDKVCGAVLIATVPHPHYTSTEFINLLINSKLLPVHEFRRQLYAIFFSEPPNDKLREIIVKSALQFSNYNYRFSFDAKNLQDHVVATWVGSDEKMLSRIKVPVLIIRARNDLVAKPEAAEILAKYIPESKYISYPHGGHFLLHRNPEEIACDIINFFNN